MTGLDSQHLDSKLAGNLLSAIPMKISDPESLSKQDQDFLGLKQMPQAENGACRWEFCRSLDLPLFVV